MTAAADFTEGEFIPDSWHFSTLITRNQAGLAAYLADEGYTKGRIILGAVLHRYHKERAVRVLVFGTGVMAVYADSWAELRPAIAAMKVSGHAALAGDTWTHGN